MKKIFTLLTCVLVYFNGSAQVILNEVYAIPGTARQEFFEFYNNSTSSRSMDNYTIVTYFEEGSSKGFYVMDLPNLSISPKGYFVGSSSVPFNYQGINNSTNSQYSWNDLAFMTANNAYLKKWVIGTTVPAAIDGNANYDLDVVPPNFNDFFSKIGGGGATYNVFIYHNGVLQSIFLGGTGGDTFLPTYILSLPQLSVDMTSTAPDFNINFSGYTNTNPEYVTQDIGSDNGYIRMKDGVCGLWTKSSAQVNHTPGFTNGGGSEAFIPEIVIASVIARGTPASGSTVYYDVVSAPTIDFPITMHLYVDNGSVQGELDVADTYLDTKVQTAVSDGILSTVFFPYLEDIILQAVSSAGCIDHERFIQNAWILPVRLTNFQASKTENGNELKWSVAENEAGKEFEIEKSTDGKNFNKAGMVNSSNRTGRESYEFTDVSNTTQTYYRIKLVNKTNSSNYSNTLLISHNTNAGKLTLTKNPVESYLNFSYIAMENSLGTINIYNTAGAKVYSQKTNLVKGINSITLNLDAKVYTGIYVLELTNNTEKHTIKFMKR